MSRFIVYHWLSGSSKSRSGKSALRYGSTLRSHLRTVPRASGEAFLGTIAKILEESSLFYRTRRKGRRMMPHHHHPHLMRHTDIDVSITKHCNLEYRPDTKRLRSRGRYYDVCAREYLLKRKNTYAVEQAVKGLGKGAYITLTEQPLFSNFDDQVASHQSPSPRSNNERPISEILIQCDLAYRHLATDW